MGDMHQYQCDSCGRTFHEFEFAETIEEMLCAFCASGIDPDGDDGDDDGRFDGQEYGYDE